MLSVVIPVYNHARFLAQAVRSALRSSLVEEVLLRDDGSADGSAAVASQLAAAHPDRVRDLTPADGANHGAAHRLNELVDLARCEWVAILNSDDVFVTGRFEAIVSDDRFKASDFFFGNVLYMNEQGTLIGSTRGPTDFSALTNITFAGSQSTDQLLELLARENFLISTSNMVFRKALHARIGGFAPYRYVHDWDFALRAFSLGRPRYIPRFLTAYRRHSSNTILEDAQGIRQEVRQAFDRYVLDFPEPSQRAGFQAGRAFLEAFFLSTGAGG